jgi:hypothetical protein
MAVADAFWAQKVVNGPQRHFAATHYFGRLWGEAASSRIYQYTT